MDAFDIMTNKSQMLLMYWSACTSGGIAFDFTQYGPAMMNGRDISDW
jgi:hypothetical protein